MTIDNAWDDSPQGIEFMESVMHPDLEWLARNVSEWPKTDGEPVSHIYRFFDVCGKPHVGRQFPEDSFNGNEYTRPQWQTARQQLGLDQPELTPVNKCLDNAWDVTPEEDRAWAEKEKKDVIPEWWKGHKQARYLDRNGRDWIDEFAETATIDEFRGAMRFTIGKYNRRAGKKDEFVKEIEKMRDYCERWLAYEAKL